MHRITLGSNPIPQRASYNYLGVPHSHSGIDFVSHIQQRSRKAMQQSEWLKNLRRQFPEWCPATLWSLYKCFVRPTVEWGLPLVAAFLKGDSVPSDSRVIKDVLTKFHHQSTAWIVDGGYCDHHHSTVNAALADLSLTSRCRWLITKLAAHIHFLHPDNPVNDDWLMGRTGQPHIPLWPQHWIRERILCDSTSLMLREEIAANGLNQEQAKRVVSSTMRHLKHILILSGASEKFTLTPGTGGRCSILHDPTTSKLLPEPWLSWRRTDRQLAFAWRVGSFGALGRPWPTTRWVCVCAVTLSSRRTCADVVPRCVVNSA